MKKFAFIICAALLIIFSFSTTVISSNSKELNNYNEEITDISNILINKYKVDSSYVKKALGSIKFRQKTLNSMTNAPERKATWERYKNIFITKERISEGIKYHKNNYKILKEIENKYGVPSEVIVAIIGVESKYGKGTGNVKVLDSLGTLALKHPRRSKFFKAQLVSFIVLTYKNNLNYNEIYGSYAGAMGAPQFMPESYIKLGVDYDNDGKVDLWNNKHDIYASVANYLNKKGWVTNQNIYTNIVIKKKYIKEIFKNGDVKTVPISKDKLKKILVHNKDTYPGKQYLALLSKKNEKYKLVHNNFKIIMTYNISTFYAMVIAQLSKEIASKNEF